jgi:hypothetical protein
MVPRQERPPGLEITPSRAGKFLISEASIAAPLESSFTQLETGFFDRRQVNKKINDVTRPLHFTVIEVREINGLRFLPKKWAKG